MRLENRELSIEHYGWNGETHTEFGGVDKWTAVELGVNPTSYVLNQLSASGVNHWDNTRPRIMVPRGIGEAHHLAPNSLTSHQQLLYSRAGKQGVKNSPVCPRGSLALRNPRHHKK